MIDVNDKLEIWSRQVPSWLWNTIVIAAAVLLGLVIRAIISVILHYYKNEKDYSLFRSIITHLGRPLNYFVPLLTINFMLPFILLGKEFIVPVNHLVEIMLIISFSSLLINAIKIFEDYIYHQYDLTKADNLKERKVRTQLIFIRKTFIVFIIVVTIAIILLSFDNVRKIGAGLLTGVGIGGIIIGFAAQKSLANFLAGFQIAVTQPIRIDDVLVVEGEWGRVEDITLTYVVLKHMGPATAHPADKLLYRKAFSKLDAYYLRTAGDCVFICGLYFPGREIAGRANPFAACFAAVG